MLMCYQAHVCAPTLEAVVASAFVLWVGFIAIMLYKINQYS